jgi:hypothetical protein
MACFAATIVEAVAVCIAAKAVAKKELRAAPAGRELCESETIPFSQKLKWLSNLLWGGSALLLFEHIWHGEVVPWFPFLTAASTPENFIAVLREIATVGVGMAALATLVWLGMLLVAHMFEKRNGPAPAEDAA